MRRRWTQSERDFVTEQYRSGKDDGEIAIALGRTAASIANYRQISGTHRPRETLKRAPEWTDSEKDIAQHLYSIGVPNDLIAAALGRSRIGVKRAIQTFGFTRAIVPINPSVFDQPAERWKRIDCAPNYAVSSQGRVMSLVPGKLGLILSAWTDSDGYVHVTLQIGRRAKRFAVHRLVALTFLGSPPSPSHHAAHNDGKRGDNRVGNIRWATPAENQADRLIHGTAMRRADGRFMPSSGAGRSEA